MTKTHIDTNKWQKWREKLRRAAPSFEACQESSDHLSRLFGEFCNVSGVVLDVGSGPRMAPYLKAGQPSLCVGLDPLAEKESGFDLVCGVGEYLPFRSSTFDHSVSGTTLDHCVRPDAVLQEMRRVTGENGRISLWIGCWAQDGTFDQPKTNGIVTEGKENSSIIYALTQDTRKAWTLFLKGDFAFLISAARTRMKRVTRPIRQLIPHKLSAKSDPYHLHHFREKDIDKILKVAGLSVLKKKKMPDGSLFLTANARPAQSDDL